MKQPTRKQTYENQKAGSDLIETEQPPDSDSSTFEALVCTECGALSQNGTWSWNQLPDTTTEALCPACTRIKDQNPAGIVTITGDFLKENRNEMISLITNIATSELSQHPLERLIDINQEQDSIKVTTTGVVIARQIGYALNIAFQGHLETTLNGEDQIYILWHRDQ